MIPVIEDIDVKGEQRGNDFFASIGIPCWMSTQCSGLIRSKDVLVAHFQDDDVKICPAEDLHPWDLWTKEASGYYRFSCPECKQTLLMVPEDVGVFSNTLAASFIYTVSQHISAKLLKLWAQKNQPPEVKKTPAPVT